MHRPCRLTLCLALAAVPALAQAHLMPPFSEIGTTISVASLRIAPKAWDHFRNARLADQSDREADFHREFARALDLEPRFAPLYLLRAAREVRLLQFDAALADVLAAQRIEPGLVSSGTILAGIYNGLHRFDDALLVLRALHGAEAGSWQVAYEFTRAHVGRGDAPQALASSAQTLKMAPAACHEAVLLRANALYLANRSAEAVEQFRLFLTLNPAPALAAQVQHAIDALSRQPEPAPETALASD